MLTNQKRPQFQCTRALTYKQECDIHRILEREIRKPSRRNEEIEYKAKPTQGSYTMNTNERNLLRAIAGIGSITAFRYSTNSEYRRILSKLQRQDFISPVEKPGSNTHRTKFRLTEKGRAVVLDSTQDNKKPRIH